MEFTLTCMVKSDDVRGRREVSVKTRARWSMVLGEGTLSVLDPVDDLVYKHGAQFVGEHSLTAVDGDLRWWRKGWTMRWLQAPNDFYAATGTMRLSAQGRAHGVAQASTLDGGVGPALYRHRRGFLVESFAVVEGIYNLV